MTKLKTLKDIEDHGLGLIKDITNKAELDERAIVTIEMVRRIFKQEREEVIKWIKEIKVNMPDMMTIQTGRFSTRDRAIRGQGKIQFIMKFFNITDKELE